MYTLNFSIALGNGKIGLSLGAQLVDTSGTNVGSLIITGFTEIGNGFYLWNYTNIPSGFRGGIKFYDQLDLVNIVAFCAINPEEAEDSSIILSTITSPDEFTANVGHSEDEFTIQSGVI